MLCLCNIQTALVITFSLKVLFAKFVINIGIYLCSTETLIGPGTVKVLAYFYFVFVLLMHSQFFLTIEYQYRRINQIEFVNFHMPKWSNF